MSNAFDKASLVMLPHAYEDGKVYSLKPTDRSGDFTFSRGTDTATRVGEDGYIKKETQNLILQSNQFDTTWTQSAVSVTSGQSGYDGTNNAWLQSKTSGSYVNIAQSVSISGVWTLSIYAKANTLDSITFRNQSDGSDCDFDLTNGTTSTNNTIAPSINLISNGWYKCSATFIGSSTQIAVYLGFGNSTAGSVFIQDAQLEQGLVARDYIETTTVPVYGGLTDNMPRLDYTDATCPSLLLEPSRTNLITYSEYRSGGTNASVVNNSTLSPEGVSNGCLFVENTALNSHGIQFSNTIPTNANAVNYTISVFAKAKEREGIQLSFFGDSITYNSNYFNIVNGTTDGDPNTHKIENYGNGWYRCSFTASVLNSTGGYNLVRFIMYNGSSSYYTGDGTSGLYMWGLQVEQGSYPTSYIPTYGSAQTRAADVCIDAGNASTFNSDEGVLYGEISKPTTILPTYSLISLNNAAANNDGNSVTIGFNTGDDLYFRVKASATNIFVQQNIPANANQLYKVALKYKSGDIKVFIDGVNIVSSTSTFSFNATLDNISFDYNGNGVLPFYGNTKQLLVFPTALSDEECIALTTL